MTAILLDGAATARAIREEVGQEVLTLRGRGIRPGLGVILVGDDAASAVYVRSKTQACEDLGIHHETVRLPSTASTQDVAARIEALNSRRDIHAILVQLPLPHQVDAHHFHPLNVGLLIQKRPVFVPCTPAGIMTLLARNGISAKGRRAVIVGRSDIVGKPMAALLLHDDATVTIAHSRTPDLAAVTREAEILVAATGKAGLITADHVGEGAVVIDVGMNRITEPALAERLLEGARLETFRKRGHALVGDVCFPSVLKKAAAITPVPGGVGPLTIAMLLKSTVEAAGRG
jgi:methylenetetrahydrofolate dehydrogenase (NADP+)/methenyltetrahydrofolate cyclohydrolase